MPRYFLRSRVLVIWVYIFVYSFSNMNLCIFMHFFYLILLELIIFKKKNRCWRGMLMWFFIIILLATSEYNMPIVHFVCHVLFFCYLQGPKYNRFSKIRDWLRSKINLGTKSRISPKCRDHWANRCSSFSSSITGMPTASW